MKTLVSAVVAAIVVLALAWIHPVLAENIPPDGKLIFNANCTACHIGGNNVIIADKTLRKEALEKYSMNSLEAIERQIKNGKNAMPSFGGRLREDQIEAVAKYVLNQAEKGW